MQLQLPGMAKSATLLQCTCSQKETAEIGGGGAEGKKKSVDCMRNFEPSGNSSQEWRLDPGSYRHSTNLATYPPALDLSMPRFVSPSSELLTPWNPPAPAITPSYHLQYRVRLSPPFSIAVGLAKKRIMHWRAPIPFRAIPHSSANNVTSCRPVPSDGHVCDWCDVNL